MNLLYHSKIITSLHKSSRLQWTHGYKKQISMVLQSLTLFDHIVVAFEVSCVCLKSDLSKKMTCGLLNKCSFKFFQFDDPLACEVVRLDSTQNAPFCISYSVTVYFTWWYIWRGFSDNAFAFSLQMFVRYFVLEWSLYFKKSIKPVHTRSWHTAQYLEYLS
jgi:hypothetical protein